MNNITTVENIILFFALIGLIIVDLEYLLTSSIYSQQSLLTWQILRIRSEYLKSNKIAQYLDVFFDYPGIIFIFGCRLFFSLFSLLILAQNSSYNLFLIFGIFILTLLVNYRNPLGQDGSDQMLNIIICILLINKLFSGNFQVREIGIFFICLQSCSSYTIAGLAKSIGNKWLEGNAVTEILSTRSYGNLYVANLLNKNLWLGKILTWSSIIIETIFPFVIILPNPYWSFFLAWGFLFHLFNAIVMGLNVFFLAFIATYPAIIYVHLVIERLLNK
ncbi:MAG: hypothetical protein VKJ02_08230 [Snowella sp.]|nr:hypothetical protein [Snowella sp.]